MNKNTKAGKAVNEFTRKHYIPKEAQEDLYLILSRWGKKEPSVPEWMPLTEARDYWHELHVNENDGIEPDWKSEMNGLKGILTKLKQKRPHANKENLFDLFVSWTKTRSKWSEFNKTKWNLNFLNSQFVNIINELNNGRVSPKEFTDATAKAVANITGATPGKRNTNPSDSK